MIHTRVNIIQPEGCECYMLTQSFLLVADWLEMSELLYMKNSDDLY